MPGSDPYDLYVWLPESEPWPIYMVVRKWLYAWLPGNDPYDLYAWMSGSKSLFVPGSNVSNMQAVSISVTPRRMAPQLWKLCNNNIWVSVSQMRKLFCKKKCKNFQLSINKRNPDWRELPDSVESPTWRVPCSLVLWFSGDLVLRFSGSPVLRFSAKCLVYRRAHSVPESILRPLC